MALGRGRYLGAAREGVPLLCVGVWELVPRAEYTAARERGELRGGEKLKAETRRRGSAGASQTAPAERDPLPADLYVARGACSTHCAVPIALLPQGCSLCRRAVTHWCCTHRGLNAVTHMRQPTEDASFSVTSHKCTHVFSKDQICTRMHCSPYI